MPHSTGRAGEVYHIFLKITAPNPKYSKINSPAVINAAKLVFVSFIKQIKNKAIRKRGLP